MQHITNTLNSIYSAKQPAWLMIKSDMGMLQCINSHTEISEHTTDRQRLTILTLSNLQTPANATLPPLGSPSRPRSSTHERLLDSFLGPPLRKSLFTGFYAFLRQHTSYAYKSLHQYFACAAFEIWNSLNYTCLFIYVYINLIPIQWIRFFYWWSIASDYHHRRDPSPPRKQSYLQFKQNIAYLFI